MSANNSNSKRNAKMSTNLNHLLNFTLPPRQTRPMTSLPRRSRKTAPMQGVWYKERFVNAQYRFVMNPHGDYTVHFADPDIFFQWQDVLQVIIPRSSALAAAAASGELSSQQEGFTNCPICLSPPTVPRMTKCGHVFCLPCILHYLSNSDNSWARCPICFDSINERQLKSVKWYDGPTNTTSGELPGVDDKDGPGIGSSSSSSPPESTLEPVVPQAGSSITMRLIQRPQITTLALPRSPTWPSDLLPPHQAPFHFLPDVFSFSKFMLATPAYLIEDLTRDLDDLEAERRTLISLNDALGLVFVDGAEHSIREEISKAVALETTALKDQVEKALRDQQDIEERIFVEASRRKAEEIAAAAAAEASSINPDVPHELLDSRLGSVTIGNQERTPPPSRPPSQARNAPRQRKNLNPPPPSTSTYYYYQAASGLPLFLHPLDIKILLSHFNTYASFPDAITVRVESVAEGTVNDDLRKRCKYLAHMPEGADVVFVEADLRGVVGAEGIKNFEGPLRMRTARRKEKVKKDDRAKARAEERERERVTAEAMSWASGARRADSPSLMTEDVPVEDVSVPAPSSSPPPGTGVWGNRSFASALYSGSPGQARRPGVGQPQSRAQSTMEDEYDIDVAWHELEQRSAGGGGRRKRGNKLVILGSGAGTGARRR